MQSHVHVMRRRAQAFACSGACVCNSSRIGEQVSSIGVLVVRQGQQYALTGGVQGCCSASGPRTKLQNLVGKSRMRALKLSTNLVPAPLGVSPDPRTHAVLNRS